MYNVEYATLNYYPQFISEECICIGILFHNVTTGQRDFRSISNFKRFQSFDDEVDVNFVKAYLSGIKEDVEISVLNYKNMDSFDLQSYINYFANEFRFSTVKKLNVEEKEDYIEEMTKIYLKYDLPKQNRLNGKDEKKLIKQILENNHLKYSMGKVEGEYKDEILFDYQLDNLCIKFFTFQGKNLRRLISTARQWSFAASELEGKKGILYIYDSDNEDTTNLKIILGILSKHATVLKMEDAMELILKECKA